MFVCVSVCVSVCLCVCSLLRYRLTVFFPPLPEVKCPIFLKIRNPWGKVMERSGLRYEHFCLKIVKIAAQKKVFFFTFFGLLRFSVFFSGLFAPTFRSRMSNIFRDSESLGKSNGKKWSQIWTFFFENFQKSPRKKKVFFCCWFCRPVSVRQLYWDMRRLYWYDAGFGGILGPPSYGIGATIRIGREMLCLPYARFLNVQKLFFF